MWTGERRATRGFLTASVVALTVPAIIVAWLGWLLLQSDRELDRQRVDERLTNAATLAIGALEQAMSTTEQRLTTLAEASDSSSAARNTDLGPHGDAAVVVMSGAELWSSTPLLYYPEEADFSDAVAAEFVAGERHEFVDRNLQSALVSYGQLAHSRSQPIRAGALVRVARVARQLGQPQAALAAYESLATMGPVPVVGRPADLVASLERCAVLHELAQFDRLKVEAQQLESRLIAGDWRVSRSQFVFYRSLVNEWRGDQPSDDAGEATARETVAAGVSAAWRLSQDTADAPGGRHTFGSPARHGLVVWRRSGPRVAALVATPAYADRVWFPGLRGIENAQRAHISLSGPADQAWFRLDVGRDAIRRSASDTGLPFTLQVASSDPAGDMSTFRGRRRLIAGMVAGLGLLVVGGGYVTARGIARELAAARLQSDFVAAVSHEFRTPVASVRQLSELLDEGRVADHTRRQEYYGLLRRESVRLQRLVENLLDFGRMEGAVAEYRLAPLDIGTLVREVTGEFEQEVRISGRRVDLATSNNAALVRADREALGRAVWNLLDNAAKYSPPETTIAVDAGSTPDGVFIRVRDQGPGIPAEEQQRIFDKFVRGGSARAGGAKGTGLGLAMVKHIVHAHHGVVRVDSQPGAGSTFSILLPAADDAR
jgi:signal transduction histidine kinase